MARDGRRYRGLVAALWLVVALGGVAWRAGAESYEFPVCTVTNCWQWQPAASGTRVAFLDRRFIEGTGDETQDNVFLYDLATGVETPICTTADLQHYPEIDGNRIVWRDDRDGGWSIYMYDTSTHVERRIASAPTSDENRSQGPDISGDYIVWADESNHPSSHHLNVMLYDLSTSTLISLTALDTDQGVGGPRISGDRVVWTDTRLSGGGQIYAYDLTTQEETVVSDNPYALGQPDVSGDVVVWTVATGAGTDVYYRDLSSMLASAPLCAASGNQHYPRVAGRWVVWLDGRDGSTAEGEEVRAYDLGHGEERQLTASSHPIADGPATVSEAGLVAWMDWRNGDPSTYSNPDVYGYYLPMFTDVLSTYWAYGAIDNCNRAGIVGGYGDGTYLPEITVTRDQMAVYIARALAGSDAGVTTPTGPATFADVPDDHWAWRYVEYAYAHAIVQGYWDGYHPTEVVNRAQMAVYIARSIADPTGEDGLASYTPPTTASFADVATDYWAYKHIEYGRAQGVVNGYWDGYHPEEAVTRGQMAVYVVRAFGLGR